MSEPAGLKLVTVSPHSGSGQPGDGPSASLHDDMAHRLALWLADVSAEAALAQMPAEASLTPWCAEPQRPRVAESTT